VEEELVRRGKTNSNSTWASSSRIDRSRQVGYHLIIN